MSIDIEEASKRVDSYISEIDKLLKMHYKQGSEKKRELDTIIQSFIRTALPNGKEKLDDYRSSVHFYVGIVGYEPSEEEEQEDYTSRLQTMRNHLVAYREELQLILNSKEKRSKLGKIREETRIAGAEAERRASVLDSKVLGAIMELLDMQRQELKRRTTLDQEIINLRKEITDLKSMFNELKNYLERRLIT